MVKCTKGEVRRLKAALRSKMQPAQRRRVPVDRLRESGMTQPEIAAAMGVSLSMVSARVHGWLMTRAASRRSGPSRMADANIRT